MDSTVFFNLDSIRFYSFSSVASANHDLHQFDTAQIILSKNSGMLKGFDFSCFPDTLEEIEILKKGPITYRDIYNYEVGDEFHYIQSSDNFNQGIQLNDKYIVRVLNKSIYSADSVSYEMEYTISDEYRIITQGHVSSNTINYMDTLWRAYQLNTVIGPGTILDTTNMLSKGIGFYSDLFRSHGYVINNAVYERYQNQLCNVFFEHDHYSEYIFGIGEFVHTLDVDMAGSEFYDENLLYYSKANTTWGIPISISVDIEENKKQKIKVFPNPANDFLKIEGLQKDATYEILDIAGRKIKEGKISSENPIIAVDDFKEGIYFMNVLCTHHAYCWKIFIQ